MPETKKIVVDFPTMDRETQNKLRFHEKDSNGKDGVIDKLYLRKSAVEKLGSPTGIRVTIEPLP